MHLIASLKVFRHGSYEPLRGEHRQATNSWIKHLEVAYKNYTTGNTKDIIALRGNQIFA